MNKRPRIAITMGDLCGIEPEVVSNALATPEGWGWYRPLVVSSAAIMADTLASGDGLPGLPAWPLKEG